jgi:SAM-dependent methyltransferase
VTPHATSFRAAASAPDLSLAAVTASIGRHMPLYKNYKPTYQTTLLRAFQTIWDSSHHRVLDVGGGTGIIAQAMKDLFHIPHVVSVDVHNRFLKTLDIEVKTYDGIRLPFADGAFDAAVFSNVLHHVPLAVRPALLAECARVVGGGPIYVKDHLAASRLDHWRLTALDAIGNIPFGGMVQANYLEASDWTQLAARAGYCIDQQISGDYRQGAFARAFPNRLEVTMRLRKQAPSTLTSSTASPA